MTNRKEPSLKLTTIVFICIIFCFSCTDNSLPTVLVLGQSNMSSWGDVDNIPSEYKEKYESAKDNVFYLGAGSYKFTDYQFMHRGGGDKYLNAFNIKNRLTCSPIYSMYAPLSELYNDHEVLIYHYAIASAAAYSSWYPEWSEERLSVFPNHKNIESKHDLYKKSKEHLMIAEKLAKEKGYSGITCKAVVWLGGEIDALNKTAANGYYNSMSSIVSALRKDLGNPELPFIIQQVNSVTLPYNNLVRSAQEAIIDSVSNCYLLSTQNFKGPSDYPKYSDNMHYDIDGVLRLGEEAGYKVIESILR